MRTDEERRRKIVQLVRKSFNRRERKSVAEHDHPNKSLAITGGSRFLSQRLLSSSLVIVIAKRGESDYNGTEECKYCNLAFGYSRIYVGIRSKRISFFSWSLVLIAVR